MTENISIEKWKGIQCEVFGCKKRVRHYRIVPYMKIYYCEKHWNSPEYSLIEKPKEEICVRCNHAESNHESWGDCRLCYCWGFRK